MTDPVEPVHTATVVGREWLSEDVFILTCSRPAGFSFLAGQHVVLSPEEGEREYTLLSPPTATELRFLVKRIKGGEVSSALAELVPGATVGMGRAKGYLVYRSTDRPKFFIATGVGIAPFVAMAAAGVTDFTLIHGARTLSGLFFRQELTAAASRYIPCLSGAIAPGDELPGLYRGRVTGWIEHSLPSGACDVYLCGSRAMITDVTLLLDQCCPEARIFSEAYS